MKKFLIIIFFSVFCTSLYSQSVRNICAILKSEKNYVAYLLDKNGNVSVGPINFGKFAVSSNVIADQIIAPTQYKLIVKPARLKLIGTCPAGGCLVLNKAKSICQNSNMYNIGVGFSFVRPGSIRPYKYSEPNEFNGIEFEDPNEFYPIEVKLKFNQSVIGELVEP